MVIDHAAPVSTGTVFISFTVHAAHRLTVKLVTWAARAVRISLTDRTQSVCWWQTSGDNIGRGIVNDSTIPSVGAGLSTQTGLCADAVILKRHTPSAEAIAV